MKGGFRKEIAFYLYTILEYSKQFLRCKIAPKVQLLQVEMQFSGASIIRYSNWILGTKTKFSFAPALLDESQLTTFQVPNCDAITESSRPACILWNNEGFFCWFF